MTRRAASEIDKEVSARVRAVRLSKRISQDKLGSAIGVTFQQVQKYESGENRISIGRLCGIAAALDVPLTELVP